MTVDPVLFTTIPKAGLQVDLLDSLWLPEPFKGLEPAPVVSFVLHRRKDGVRVTGSIGLVLTLQCDRCLDLYKKKIEGDFSVDLVVGPPEPLHEEQVEYICSAADMDTMFIESAQVDLDEIARQQLYLQLPVKKICETDCPGLCQCGKKKGSRSCTCEKIIDSPFAALSKMSVAKKD